MNQQLKYCSSLKQSATGRITPRQVQLHSKSVWQAPGLWHGTAASEGFFGVASALQGQQSRDEVADRIRFFAEGCDSVQGFNVMADDLGGWGQVTADLLGELHDDYPASPVMLWATRQSAAGAPSTDAAGAAAHRRRQLSEAFSYATLAPLASSFCCVAPPSSSAAAPWLLPQRLETAFGASGAVAAALDCATLPWRLTLPAGCGTLGRATGAVSMEGLAQLLRGDNGSGLAALRVALPAPSLPYDPHAAGSLADDRQHPQHQQAGSQQRQRLAQSRNGGHDADSHDQEYTRDTASWTPGISGASSETEAEMVVLRGSRTAAAAAATSDHAAATLDASLAAEGVRCVQQRCVVPLPLPLPLPFPRLFSANVGRLGDISPPLSAQGNSSAAASAGRAAAQQAGNFSGGPVSTPVLTRLASSRGFRAVLAAHHRHLQSAVRSAAGHATVAAWGLSRDDVSDCTERLHDLGAGYGDADSGSLL